MPIRAKILKTYFSGFIGIAIAAFFVSVFSSCLTSESHREVYKVGEVNKMIDKTYLLVDSLVQEEHPDPVAFLDSATQASPLPVIVNLFHKYAGESYYYSEHLNDFETAEIYADSTLQLFDEAYSDPELKVYHLYSILRKGDLLRKQHLYGMSVQYYLQGLQIIDPENNPCIGVEYLGRLGSISYQQGNYRNSIDFYSQAQRTSFNCAGQTEFDRFRTDFQYFQNIAANYENLQMPERALHYQNLSLDILEKDSANYMDDPDHRYFIELANGVALGNKAAVYQDLGRGEEAEILWKKSIRINMRPGFANEHAELMRLELADYYIDEGRMDEAERELALGRNWLDKFHSETGERRWRKARWRWLERMGSTEEAYTAYKQYVEMREMSVNHRVEANTIDLDAQVRLYEQQNEITQLQSERKLRRVYIVLIAIIFIMVIAILFLIWRNWQKSKKNVQALGDLGKRVFNQKLQLEKSNKAITRIMNMVAHDLRNPLTGIKGLSSMLLNDGNLMDEQKKWIRLMHDSSGHAMELINEMMDSNVLDVLKNGHKSIKKDFADMRPYLKRCVDVLQFRAREKGQAIELDLEEDATVSLNRDAMFRVIGNLIGNAIKFSHKDSTIYLSMENLNDTVLLSIRDSGIGIPDDLKEKAFDMFTEAKRPGTVGEQSFGLGLSISKQIVKAHGGSIWLESEEEKGTTVYIELPVIDNILKENEILSEGWGVHK